MSSEALLMRSAASDEAATRVPPDWPGARYSRHVNAAGVRWHVQESGAGPALLLLHGAGASAHSWRGVATLLEQRFRIINIDLPGHGFSSAWRGGDYSLTRTARAVASLLEALGVDVAAVIGHSAGAAIALQMQLDRAAGSRAVRPVLGVNPALLPFDGVAGLVFPLFARLAAASALLAATLARRARDVRQVRRIIAGTGSDLSSTQIGYYATLMQRPAHVRSVLSMMACWQLERLLPAITALDPPLSVVLGERDRAVPPARTAAALQPLTQTAIVRLPNVGHLAHEEAPAAVVAALRPRLEQLAGAAP